MGCYIGYHFVFALAYADDIVLISPAPSTMRRLLLICDNFAYQNDVIFNPTKSKCVVINSRSANIHNNCIVNYNFTISSQPIEIVQSYKHLGHVINYRFDDRGDIAEKRLAFIGQCNNVICYFSKLTSAVKQRLLSSFCTSFFGCELWSLNCSDIDNIAVVWRSALKRVWSIPRKSHGYLVHFISNSPPVQDIIRQRSLNFINKCLIHPSKLISAISTHGVA